MANLCMIAVLVTAAAGAAVAAAVMAGIRLGRILERRDRAAEIDRLNRLFEQPAYEDD